MIPVKTIVIEPLLMTLLDALVDVTLIDEDMKSILIDDANKEISSNMTMQLAPPGVQISY